MGIYSADKLLTKRLLAHDERAFREFFDLYFERLYRFALNRLARDREAARDVTQMTLTRAIQKIDGFRGEASLYTWLCTLCRRQVADYYRRESKHFGRVDLIEDNEEIRGALESMDAEFAATPESGYAREERARIIQVALDQLPARYGDALEWKYIYGYSTVEIAERLGVGREAAQSLLARARRAFHEAYSTMTRSLTTADGSQPQSAGS